MIYRIKPLEWNDNVFRRQTSGDYEIHNLKDTFAAVRVIDPMFSQERLGSFDSLDKAKAACERDRLEELLEDTIIPAYQPTTELPTEPGLYWCLMNGFRSMWLVTDDGEDAIGFTCLLGSLPDDCKMTDAVNHGKWIRIPEPEAEP